MVDVENIFEEEKRKIGGIDVGAFSFRYVKSSGPGGQNVNKRSTKAEMRVDLDQVEQAVGQRVCDRLKRIASYAYISDSNELLIASQAWRSQGRNRDECVRLFEVMMLKARIEPKKRKKKKISQAAKRKRVEAKRKRSKVKQMRSKIDDV